MGVWGPGILQSDNDYDYCEAIAKEVDVEIFNPEDDQIDEVVRKLNEGLLDKAFNKFLNPRYHHEYEWLRREKMVLYLGILVMQCGATIKSTYLIAMRVLVPTLPSVFQQIQVLTAIDEYKNDGTPWVIESLGLLHTATTGSPMLGSGIGHSADEQPYPYTHSKTCMGCGDTDPKFHCGGCKMARYCTKNCQKGHWHTHKTTCFPEPGAKLPSESTDSAGTSDTKDHQAIHEVE